jgi:hypothetical protein
MREGVDLHFRALEGEPLAAIAAVAMDMWGAFVASVSEHVPDAERKIAFDMGPMSLATSARPSIRSGAAKTRRCWPMAAARSRARATFGPQPRQPRRGR